MIIKRLIAISLAGAILSGLLACSEPAGKLYEQAGLDSCQGEWDGAISSYSLLIERYPQSRFAPMATLKLGDIFGFEKKDFDRALETYDTLIYHYPQSEQVPDALMSKAEIIKERRQDLSKSLEISELVYQRHTGYERKDYLLIFMARCLEAMKGFTRERAILRELLLSYPRSPYTEEGYYMYGMACLADGLIEESLLVFKSYLGKYPGGRFAARAEIGYSEALLEGQGKRDAATYLTAAAKRYEAEERDIIEERLDVLKSKASISRLRIPGRRLGGKR